MFSCENNKSTDKALNEDDVKKFKQDVEKEIMARKIDIMQMKQDINQLQDSIQSKFFATVNESEQRLLKLQDSYEEMKDRDASIWINMKTKVDSSIRYLGAQIDSTKLNILIEKEKHQ